MKKIIGIIIGIACVVIGIFIMISHFNAQKTQTAETTAKIVRIDSEVEIDVDTNGLETRYYTPVVEYTVNSKTYEKQLPNSRTTDSTEYQEGQEITIQYNPDKPEEFSSKGDNGGLIGGIIFIVIGIIATIGSFIGKF